MFSLKNRFFQFIGPSTLKTIPSASFRSKVNPGARRRLKLTEDIKESDVDDLDYEADFESVNRSHKQHMIEMVLSREKLQCQIVKQKYFKTKYPNFLTWHDKEQIRLLHNKDPEEWDVMKLSEGFPALPDTIKKIIKSYWRKDKAKIKSHDASVQENWRKFENDEFKDLPEGMIEHLKKFSNRKLNFQSYEDTCPSEKIQFNNKPTCTEFSEIITSYQELKTKKQKICDSKDNSLTVHMNNIKYPSKEHYEEETYYSGRTQNKHILTLDSLQNKLQKDMERGRDVSFTEKSIAEMTNSKNIQHAIEKVKVPTDDLESAKYNTGRIMVLDQKKQAAYDHLVYPEKISIPKKIMKQGYTYKLNDCYYDSDGKFLYRVPGMC